MRKGLDKKTIVVTSLQMIDKEGRENFSLHKLAKELGIKTASLYNHVNSLHDLLIDVSIEVIHRLIQAEQEAMAGKSGDSAIRALADAYVHFGLEHFELYQIFMEIREVHAEVLEMEGLHILDPFRQAFADIKLPFEQKIHWERILRSILHGFIAQKHAGFFTLEHIDSRLSLQKAIDCFLLGIHTEEKNVNI